MKLFWFLCVFFFFFEISTLNGLENSNEDENFGAEKTKFLDLNGDCHHLILEQLSILDLMSLADTNQQMRDVVETHARNRFARKLIVFDNPLDNALHNDNPLLYNNKPIVEETEDQITAIHFAFIRPFLQRFGHLIPKILAKNDLQDFTANQVSRLINLYCSDTLISLEVVLKFRDVFVEYKKPFTALKSLLVGGYHESRVESNSTFNEMFPVLQRLEIFSTFFRDYNWSRNVPQLEELSIRTAYWEEQQESAREIIGNNTQLKAVSFSSVKPSLLRLVASTLLDLERLSINYYNSGPQPEYDGIEIHFENVKSFSLNDDMPSQITFDRLEELEIGSRYWPKDRVFELISIHNETLKKITFVDTFLEDSDIIQLANARLSVDEMTLDCLKNVDVNNVIKLIENNSQLKKLKIYFQGESDMDLAFDALQERFSHERIITKTHAKKVYEISIEWQ